MCNCRVLWTHKVFISQWHNMNLNRNWMGGNTEDVLQWCGCKGSRGSVNPGTESKSQSYYYFKLLWEPWKAETDVELKPWWIVLIKFSIQRNENEDSKHNYSASALLAMQIAVLARGILSVVRLSVRPSHSGIVCRRMKARSMVFSNC